MDKKTGIGLCLCGMCASFLECNEEIAYCLAEKGTSNCIKVDQGVFARDALYRQRRISSMSITAHGEAKPDNLIDGKIWKCAVCGYTARGEKPPAECPQCAGSVREFFEPAERKRFAMTGNVRCAPDQWQQSPGQ